MKYLCTLTFISLINILFGQALYLGNGSDGSTTITSPTIVNEYYVVSNFSSSQVVVDLSTSTLASGDLVILIQMEGPQSGNFSYHKVTNVTTSGTLRYVDLDTSTPVIMSDYDALPSPNAKIQLIKVPQYQNITLQNDIITNDYNNGLYGIIAIAVKGICTFDGGTLNANGKGFTGGFGGFGGSGGTGGNGGQHGTAPSFLGMDGGTTGTIAYTGLGGGGNGGVSGGNGNNGTPSTNLSFPGNGSPASNLSNFTSAIENLILLPGGGGNGGNGGDGGNGAGGGGGGGSTTTSLGGNGTNGGNGGNGGLGGNGGNGGGIILFFADEANFTTNQTMNALEAMGNNATLGNGGYPGMAGGDGGMGGLNCSTGGPGGGGNGANGGNGGNGGSGGAGGSVLYYYRLLNGVSDINSHIDLNGGLASNGQSGGVGGLAGMNANPSVGSPCNPIPNPSVTFQCNFNDLISLLQDPSMLYNPGNDTYTNVGTSTTCEVIALSTTDSYIICSQPSNIYLYSYLTSTTASSYSGQCLNDYVNNVSGTSYVGTTLSCGSNNFETDCSYRAMPIDGANGVNGLAGADGSTGKKGSVSFNTPCDVVINSLDGSCVDNQNVYTLDYSIIGTATITKFEIIDPTTSAVIQTYASVPPSFVLSSNYYIFKITYLCGTTQKTTSQTYFAFDYCGSSSGTFCTINPKIIQSCDQVCFEHECYGNCINTNDTIYYKLKNNVGTVITEIQSLQDECFTLNNAGNYQLVYDIGHCLKDSITFNNAPYHLDYTLTNNCPTVTLSFSNTIGTGTIDWGDGNIQVISSFTNTISHTYTFGGNYTISGIVRNNNCTASISESIDIDCLLTSPTFSCSFEDVPNAQEEEYALDFFNDTDGNIIVLSNKFNSLMVSKFSENGQFIKAQEVNISGTTYFDSKGYAVDISVGTNKKYGFCVSSAGKTIFFTMDEDLVEIDTKSYSSGTLGSFFYSTDLINDNGNLILVGSSNIGGSPNTQFYRLNNVLNITQSKIYNRFTNGKLMKNGGQLFYVANQNDGIEIIKLDNSFNIQSHDFYQLNSNAYSIAEVSDFIVENSQFTILLKLNIPDGFGSNLSNIGVVQINTQLNTIQSARLDLPNGEQGIRIFKASVNSYRIFGTYLIFEGGFIVGVQGNVFSIEYENGNFSNGITYSSSNPILLNQAIEDGSSYQLLGTNYFGSVNQYYHDIELKRVDLDGELFDTSCFGSMNFTQSSLPMNSSTSNALTAISLPPLLLNGTVSLTESDYFYNRVCCDDHTSGGICNALFSYSYGVNGQIIFSNSSSFATTYSWDLGDGNTSNQYNPTHFYCDDSPKLVTLTITHNSTGCTDTYSQVIIPPSIPNINIVSNGSCNQINLGLDDYTAVTGLLWDFGDGNTSTSLFPNHTYFPTSTNQFTVTANFNQNGCARTITKQVTAYICPCNNGIATVDMPTGNGSIYTLKINSSHQVNVDRIRVNVSQYSANIYQMDLLGNSNLNVVQTAQNSFKIGVLNGQLTSGTYDLFKFGISGLNNPSFQIDVVYERRVAPGVYVQICNSSVNATGVIYPELPCLEIAAHQITCLGGNKYKVALDLFNAMPSPNNFMYDQLRFAFLNNLSISNPSGSIHGLMPYPSLQIPVSIGPQSTYSTVDFEVHDVNPGDQVDFNLTASTSFFANIPLYSCYNPIVYSFTMPTCSSYISCNQLSSKVNEGMNITESSLCNSVDAISKSDFSPAYQIHWSVNGEEQNSTDGSQGIKLELPAQSNYIEMTVTGNESIEQSCSESIGMWTERSCACPCEQLPTAVNNGFSILQTEGLAFVFQPRNLEMCDEVTWDMDGDETIDYYSTGNESVEHTFNEEGSYPITMNVARKSELGQCPEEKQFMGQIDVFLVGLDTEENQQIIAIYPNPTTNHLMISSNKLGKIKGLEMYSMNGVLMDNISVNSTSPEFKYNLEHFPSGTYICVLKGEDFIKSFKVVKL